METTRSPLPRISRRRSERIRTPSSARPARRARSWGFQPAIRPSSSRIRKPEEVPDGRRGVLVAGGFFRHLRIPVVFALAPLAFRLEDDGQLLVEARIVGCELDGLPERVLGLLELTPLPMDPGSIAEGFRVLGVGASGCGRGAEQGGDESRCQPGAKPAGCRFPMPEKGFPHERLHRPPSLPGLGGRPPSARSRRSLRAGSPSPPSRCRRR